jgi:hypothetical protein
MANPPNPPVWAVAETVFPPSAYPWSGQPIIVPFGTDYLSPSPATGSPLKVCAENVNWLWNAMCNYLATLQQNSVTTVTSLTDMRALPVPAYNQTVLLTPEDANISLYFPVGYQNILQMQGPNRNAYNIYGGGYYYWDPLDSHGDDSYTHIQPTSVSGNGRWRLQGGGPLFTPLWNYIDVGILPYATGNIVAVESHVLFVNGSQGFTMQLVTGDMPYNMFEGDMIVVDGDFQLVAGAGQVLTLALETNGSPDPVTPSYLFPPVTGLSSTTAGTIHGTWVYTVQAADITRGNLILKPTIATFAAVTPSEGTIIELSLKILRS